MIEAALFGLGGAVPVGADRLVGAGDGELVVITESQPAALGGVVAADVARLDADKYRAAASSKDKGKGKAAAVKPTNKKKR